MVGERCGTFRDIGRKLRTSRVETYTDDYRAQASAAYLTLDQDARDLLVSHHHVVRPLDARLGCNPCSSEAFGERLAYGKPGEQRERRCFRGREVRPEQHRKK